jgi:hypothetical protein
MLVLGLLVRPIDDGRILQAIFAGFAKDLESHSATPVLVNGYWFGCHFASLLVNFISERFGITISREAQISACQREKRWRCRDNPAGTGMFLFVGEYSTRRSSCSCETRSLETAHDSGRDKGEELMSPDGDSGFGNRGLISHG